MSEEDSKLTGGCDPQCEPVAESKPEKACGGVSPDDVGVDSEEGSDEGSEGSEELCEESDTQEASPEQLLAMGKKCLVAGDATGAVEHFQEACSILAEVYGQVAKELAEPYYMYGQALLELAREKSAMFGKGIPVPEDVEGGSSSAADDAGTSGENDGGPASSTPSAPDTSAPDTSESKPAEEEESDLQLSWNVLELARVICQREGDDKLQLSDVHLALGEVSMESDQYEQAIADLQSSLRLREFVLDPTDRRIAEVHFNLGMVHTLAKQADEAIAAYNASKNLLNQRREMLKTQLAGESDVAHQEELQCEIRELEGLIPDVESKIADVEDFKKVLQERENNEPEEECIGFDAPSKELAASNLSAVAPVNDITHLIRKRKVDSETSGTEGDVTTKRVCAESVTTNSTAGEDSASPCQSTLPPAAEQ